MAVRILEWVYKLALVLGVGVYKRVWLYTPLLPV